MKTVISANVPISLAIRLKDKTKGTRSRVISRALQAYLDEKDAFDLWEWEVTDILLHLMARSELTNTQRELIYKIKEELK
jgi:metal-responsive CopG/Arc/MetJ family transcriptional regulator|tara:strand:- start:1747 stop:1986 length:240 start_codon:yes stop_codon:yes gene_type:complete